jgi:hypothetical protein
MRYKLSPKHLNLLKEFTLTEDGLVPLDETLITEYSMPQYIVSMWISAYPVEIRIGTHSGSGGAMAICRKLFPSARIISAKKA